MKLWVMTTGTRHEDLVQGVFVESCFGKNESPYKCVRQEIIAEQKAIHDDLIRKQTDRLEPEVQKMQDRIDADDRSMTQAEMKEFNRNKRLLEDNKKHVLTQSEIDKLKKEAYSIDLPISNDGSVRRDLIFSSFEASRSGTGICPSLTAIFFLGV